jgi:integrase
VERLAGEFIEKYCKPRNRSWKATEGYFRREVIPAWRGKSVHEVRREHIEDLVDRIAEDGRGVMANRTLAAVHRWFAWMLGKGRSSLQMRLAGGNPASGIERPGQERSRERVLSADEIRVLWQALDAEHEPHGQLIKLLLLTGARRGEVAGMRRSELDLDKRIWNLPAARTKNGHAHTIALSNQAVAILESLHHIVGDYMFTIDGLRPVAFSRVKRRLDARMKLATPWTLHDLRRSAATGLADIGVQPHVIEEILNHRSGHRRGAAAIYNRSVYSAETAAALQRWSDHIEGLVAGKVPKVIPISRGAAAVPA